MPGDPQQTARLRALHEDCVWKVNAAVAEGREDLVRMLSEEYLEQAVRILAPGAQDDGAMCGSARPAPPRRRRWGGR